MVADALSRKYDEQINMINNTKNSAENTQIEQIKRVAFPLNNFKNQYEISKSDHNSLKSKTIFQNNQYHRIKFKTRAELITYLKNTVSNKHINAIYSTEETFSFIKDSISNTFPNSKFVFTTIKSKNIENVNEQLDIVSKIHNRAHRNARNNYIEAQKKYFWPKMKRDLKNFTKQCEICKTQKYERVPAKQPIGSTPIPTSVGSSISMDIFHIDNKLYVTSVDRYSKYLMIHPIDSKIKFHEKLEEILTQNYPKCKNLITDNEAIFISNASKIILEKYKITHITTPVQHSTSNGEVERTHGTLIEIIRCLSKQNNKSSSEEIFNAVKAYNETVHSVTGEKPIDVKQNPSNYPKIEEKILEQQEKMLKYHNKGRENRVFVPNEIIYVKSNRRRKDASAYTKHKVREDLGNSILTTNNKIYHKDSIRINNK